MDWFFVFFFLFFLCNLSSSFFIPLRFFFGFLDSLLDFRFNCSIYTNTYTHIHSPHAYTNGRWEGRGIDLMDAIKKWGNHHHFVFLASSSSMYINQSIGIVCVWVWVLIFFLLLAWWFFRAIMSKLNGARNSQREGNVSTCIQHTLLFHFPLVKKIQPEFKRIKLSHRRKKIHQIN